MEDILEVYHSPYSEKNPLVCMDETSKQLLKETRIPIAVQPGKTLKYDYEYERCGVNNIFMVFAPLQGLRYVFVPIDGLKLIGLH